MGRRLTFNPASVSGLLILLLSITALSGEVLFAQTVKADSPLILELSEEYGLERNSEPVELELRIETASREALAEIVSDPATTLRVIRLNENGEVEINSQITRLEMTTTGSVVVAELLFLAEVPANGTVQYRIERQSPEIQGDTDLTVRGEGVGRIIENRHFRILTDSTSGQIDQIDLKFTDRPSFRFEPGNMHWNPDFIIVPDDYPDRSYSWPAARNMEDPEYEVDMGPLAFTITRRQFIPGQERVFTEVRYRFYAGLPWYLMESEMKAVREFRTFGVRNDELAFGVGDFTHAGWRTESVGLHPQHRGEIGVIPLYDDSRPGRHVLGSALSPWTPWLSYSNNERGYAVATLRLGWDNRNLLTGEPAPIVNARTVLSSNNGAPYWFRSLVYTPRRAHDDSFFNLEQEVINEMVQLIPRGTAYFERNAYYFYPFDADSAYQPADNLYLKLTNPLQVRFPESE